MISITSFTYEYFILLLFLIFSIALSLVILGISYFFSVQNPDTEKLSSYECGFDPYGDSRDKVTVQFYIIAILFIIFDLEALFLYPWAVSLTHTGSVGFWCMFDFLIELAVGYYYVWRVGALEWD